MWERRPGFATLVHMILEQQVSLASAKAAFDRLGAAASPLTPERFLEFDARELKRIGFSRQKTDYCRRLAHAVLDRTIDMRRWNRMEDDAVRAELTTLKGVGPWTADVYLLMVLRRPDVWPVGDRALAVSAQRVKRLHECPTPERLDRIGKRWQPWRAVAARLLWHDYLSVREQAATGQGPLARHASTR